MTLIKKTALFVVIIQAFTSCQSKNKEAVHLASVKTYYEVLNHPDTEALANLIGDSIVIIETESNHEERFSREGYLHWAEWDSVFHPTYNILQIEEDDGLVKAKISKVDTRIEFLNEKPMVWNETIRFKNHKISTVEHTEYLIFNESLFLKKRQDLVDWIDQNHPELNGFLYDQTLHGALDYLKALELYKAR